MQEAVSIEDIIPYVAARVPDADEMAIEFAIRMAAIQFMKDTRLFHDQVVFYGQSGVKEYILEIPDDIQMIDIRPDGVTLNGQPYYNFVKDGHYDVVLLTQPPVAGGCYTVDYAYSIKPDACEIPLMLFDNYLEHITLKAILLLYTGTSKSPVSTNLYTVAKQEYQDLIDRIFGQRLHNFSNGRPRMKRRSRRGIDEYSHL